MGVSGPWATFRGELVVEERTTDTATLVLRKLIESGAVGLGQGPAQSRHESGASEAALSSAPLNMLPARRPT
jgi:hypothetical protein